jgi:hypothetical protein
LGDPSLASLRPERVVENEARRIRLRVGSLSTRCRAIQCLRCSAMATTGRITRACYA